VTESRAELRARLRAERAALAPQQRIAAAQSLHATLEQLPEFLVDTRVAGYWAVGGEMPLLALLGPLRARAQRYHLPVIGVDNTLRFAPWQAGAPVQANRYGIPEPESAADLVAPEAMELVLVPLLGFDRRGNRLGMGAGYYNRGFAFLRDAVRPAQPLLVGIGYHFQEVAALPSEPWDVRLDFVATDRELIDCTETSA